MTDHDDTERLERMARTAAREAVRASGEHRPDCTPCPYETAIKNAGTRLDDHSDRFDRIDDILADGRVEFANLRKDIERLTEAVNQLRTIVAWVGGTVGVGLLGVTGSALMWAIQRMGTTT